MENLLLFQQLLFLNSWKFGLCQQMGMMNTFRVKVLERQYNLYYMNGKTLLDFSYPGIGNLTHSLFSCFCFLHNTTNYKCKVPMTPFRNWIPPRCFIKCPKMVENKKGNHNQSKANMFLKKKRSLLCLCNF